MTLDQAFDQFLQDHGYTDQPFGMMVKLRRAFEAGALRRPVDPAVERAIANRERVAITSEGQQWLDTMTHSCCPACLGSGHCGDVPKHIMELLEGRRGQETN